ncbi:MAG: response regulator, partial [Spirochaetia bacterium]|nr:response regulator [Spirochaetia bacterium]
MKVLIVDDSRIMRQIIEKYLSDFSIEVRTADNGEDAIEIFERFMPDVVTLD